MKRLVFILSILVLVGVAYFAAEYDRSIQFNELPPVAQQLINANFPHDKSVYITADWDDFKVVLSGGQKLEFDRNGNWTDIECGTTGVPEALLPAQILTHIQQSFPGAKVIGISADWQGYDVELNTGIEIEYDKNFQVSKIDD